MSRDELKEIIRRVVEKLQDEKERTAPSTGCIFGDTPDPCDVTTYYAVGEED